MSIVLQILYLVAKRMPRLLKDAPDSGSYSVNAKAAKAARVAKRTGADEKEVARVAREVVFSAQVTTFTAGLQNQHEAKP